MVCVWRDTWKRRRTEERVVQGLHRYVFLWSSTSRLDSTLTSAISGSTFNSPGRMNRSQAGLGMSC